MEAAQAAVRGKEHKEGDGNVSHGDEPDTDFERESGLGYEGDGEDEESNEEENSEQDVFSENDLNNNNIERKTGVQVWPDGSSYKGEFGFDLKLGYGEFAWDNGERYVGQFYKDHRHGKGVYFWPNGSKFSGSFYLSRKEGYGMMEFNDGRTFQGLYKADERFGPGIETHPDYTQDVGLWHRNHIVKLCTEIPGYFILSNFPELNVYFDAESTTEYISEEGDTMCNLNEENDPFFYNFKRLIFSDDNYTLPENMHAYSIDAEHLPLTRTFRKEFDFQYFKKRKRLAYEKRWPITNITPFLVRMQKHIYKYRHCRKDINWSVNFIAEGHRNGFGAKGPNECAAEELIEKSAEGDYNRVYEILKNDLAHPDIADSHGYTALAAAAMHYQDEIINLLLDSGADVNKCSDEGLSALSMCIIRYFPAESFVSNIAERNHNKREAEEMGEEMSQDSAELSQSEPSQPSAGSTDNKISSATTPVSPALLSLSEKTDGGNDNEGKSSEETECTIGEKSCETICGVYNYKIKVSSEVIQQGAAILSHNILKMSCVLDHDEIAQHEGTVRRMAVSITEQKKRLATIQVLLRRGADPNMCRLPMYVLFFAVKAANAKIVRMLLEAGAKTDIRLPTRLGGVTPLHIASALPVDEGVEITELLLHSATDPDVRAEDENTIYRMDRVPRIELTETPSLMKMFNETGPPKSYYSKCNIIPEEGGRTPLHIACERKDNFKAAAEVTHLLLEHGANPNLLWSGHSPLSLAVATGNNPAVNELLANGAEPNLQLGQNIGSALCAVTNPSYERRRTLPNKITLVDTLIAGGAEMLMPIIIGDGTKSAVGTVVDYAFFKYYKDKRMMHAPYHALSPQEREVFGGRRKLLEYLSEKLREAVLLREKQWDKEELQKIKMVQKGQPIPGPGVALHEMDPSRLSFFKFCYQCGRSVGVVLSPCTRCYEVYTCSKTCKAKFWNEHHKRECMQTDDSKPDETESALLLAAVKKQKGKKKGNEASSSGKEPKDKKAASRLKVDETKSKLSKKDQERERHEKWKGGPDSSNLADLPYTGNYSFI